MTWFVLVLLISHSSGVAMDQVGTFDSEEQCLSALDSAEEGLGTWRYTFNGACLETDREP